MSEIVNDGRRNPDSALDTVGLVSPLEARRPEYVRLNCGQPYRLSVSCGFTNWFMPRLSTAMLISCQITNVTLRRGSCRFTRQISQYITSAGQYSLTELTTAIVPVLSKWSSSISGCAISEPRYVLKARGRYFIDMGSCNWRKANGMLAHNNCFSWLPSTLVYKRALTPSNSSEGNDRGKYFRTAPSPRTLLTLLISTDATNFVLRMWG